MVETSRHTRVCSVLFIDIIVYSRKTVAEQLVMKRACNDLVAEALGATEDSDRVILSGTKVRELLSQKQLPPMEFSRPEVARILMG